MVIAMADIQELQDPKDFKIILLANRKSINMLTYDLSRLVHENYFS